MLSFHRIDISLRTDVNKICESKECDRFKFQINVWNGCHDVVMMSMNLSDIAILKIHSADYHCIITANSKSEAKNSMQKGDLKDKKQTLQNTKIYYKI